ncbi:MAG TPA: cytochrome c peroxidase [Methylocella sp.]|nr:cytochrome c peroxidase [Methylocella sp.]
MHSNQHPVFLPARSGRIFFSLYAAAWAIAAAAAWAFPQAAAAQRQTPAPAGFEALRQRLQDDLKRSSLSAKPASDPGCQLESLLGGKLYSDKNLSRLRNQSCASCHQLNPAINPETGQPFPVPGFVDAENVERGTPVSDGSVAGRFGRLNAPSVGYAAFSPPFHWDKAEELYVGGQFWNGRASTLADQAAQPFLNPDEMAMPGKAAVVERLKENPSYRLLFWMVYKLKIARALSPAGIDAVYDAMTKAIAAFERTRQFRKFTSKFDYFMAGKTELTPLERRGLNLFNNKAKCAACHISTPAKKPDGTWAPALFTDFTYDNIGAPRNLNIPGNPEPDKGLGGRPDIAAADPQGFEIGKHKVMTLRNIAITPPYGHNGVFKTLEQITHFYNTRDTLGRVPDNRHPGFGVTGWPPPEVPQNVNASELGNLGLSPGEEAALVAFMKTLTDGYPLWGGDPGVPPGTPAPYGP